MFFQSLFLKLAKHSTVLHTQDLSYVRNNSTECPRNDASEKTDRLGISLLIQVTLVCYAILDRFGVILFFLKFIFL